MSPADELLIRVDASLRTGLGHVMRCLALAQAWRDSGGTAAFLMAESLPAFEDRLSREGLELLRLREAVGGEEDARRTAEIATRRGSAWVVLDGYRFGGDYQKVLKALVPHVLAMDDYGHTGHCSADLVLNQNASARANLYADREPGTRLLLGPRYVLLQRAFRALPRKPRPTASRTLHVLVTLGGVDAPNVTLKVVRALQHAAVGDLEARVVVGSANPNLASLAAATEPLKDRVRLEQDPASLADPMAWADLAVAGAGTTSYELAYMGVPSLLLVLADNQRRVAEAMDAAGVAENLGWHSDVTEAELGKAVSALAKDQHARERMTQAGRALVDGEGASRVVTNLKAGLLTLRRVEEGDIRLLWEWANDSSVRSVSFTQAPIPWSDHVRWFAAKLADPHCSFYIGLDAAGTPLGEIRFDGHGDEADVSVSLDARHRGRGQGSALILAGSRKVFDATGIRTIHAYVKEGNEPSVRAFVKAGYIPAGNVTLKGQPADQLILRKEATG